MLSMSTKNSKRLTAYIMSFMILLIVLFSGFYIAAESHHNCTGENCPVCICIQQCENTLRQIKEGISLLYAAVVPVIFVLVSAFLFAFGFSQETPVSRKVRLND